MGITTAVVAGVPNQALTKPLPVKLGNQHMTLDWLLTQDMSFSRPSIRWLDKDHLIFSLPVAKKDQSRKIEKININTLERQTLAEGSTPVPSPDGKWLVYKRGEDKQKQLWIMQSDGSEIHQLTQVEGGLGHYMYSYDFAWSKGSKKLALSHQPFIEPWIKGRRSETKIDVIDVLSGKIYPIGSVSGRATYISWLPDNENLLFVNERVGDIYNEKDDHDWIQVINLHTHQIHTLADFKGLQQFLMPIISPDGKKAAISYDPDIPLFTVIPSIGLLFLEVKNKNVLAPIARLTKEIKLWGFKWEKDGKNIYALRDFGAYKQIYRIDSRSGKEHQLTNAPLNIESYDISPDQSKIAWIGQDAHGTRIIRLSQLDGSDVRDLLTISAVPENTALSEVREIEWKTKNYPSLMRGLLIMPLNYQQGLRYPLIVDIHGGGVGAHIFLAGGILVSTPLEWQLWAAKGYAVFVPEFRSSGSFGSLAIMRDMLQEHDDINQDIVDIDSGVDYLISQGIADPNRLAIIGHSAGGRRANWLTVATHRYKAVVSKEGWADELIQISNELPNERYYFWFGGSPFEVPQHYMKNSALFHARSVTTPTLFIRANPEKGGADPYDTMHMLHHMLKNQRVETEYVYYPDEGHVFEKVKNQRDVFERTIQWIDRHLNQA